MILKDKNGECNDEETVGNLVWVPTQGGKKYHISSGCSNMDEPMQVSVETAQANGYTAFMTNKPDGFKGNVVSKYINKGVEIEVIQT